MYYFCICRDVLARFKVAVDATINVMEKHFILSVDGRPSWTRTEEEVVILFLSTAAKDFRIFLFDQILIVTRQLSAVFGVLSISRNEIEELLERMR